MVFWLIYVVFCKLAEQLLFMKSSGFLLSTLPCTPSLFSVLLMFISSKLTFTNGVEILDSLDVNLGFFEIS